MIFYIIVHNKSLIWRIKDEIIGIILKFLLIIAIGLFFLGKISPTVLPMILKL